MPNAAVNYENCRFVQWVILLTIYVCEIMSADVWASLLFYTNALM